MSSIDDELVKKISEVRDMYDLYFAELGALKDENKMENPPPLDDFDKIEDELANSNGQSKFDDIMTKIIADAAEKKENEVFKQMREFDSMLKTYRSLHWMQKTRMETFPVYRNNQNPNADEEESEE